MEDFTELLNELNDSKLWYLDGIRDQLDAKEQANIFKECRLFHIDRLIYEPSEYYLSAFEHILDSVRMDGVLFLMLMLKTKSSLDFYFGVAPESESDRKNAKEAAEILEAEFETVFLEAELSRVTQSEAEQIITFAQSFSVAASLEGIPGTPEQQKSLLSKSRFARILKNDSYAVILMAKPLKKQSTEQIEQGIQYIYNSLFSFASRTKSFEETDVCTTSGSIQVAGSDGSSINRNRAMLINDQGEKSEENKDPIHKNCSANSGQNRNNSLSKTVVHTSRCTNLSQSTVGAFGVKTWLEFLGKTLTGRMQNGKVNGIYLYRLMLYTETAANMKKLEMLLKKNCYGDVTALLPVRLSLHPKDKIPGFLSCKKTEQVKKEYRVRNAFSQTVSPDGSEAGIWVTRRELSSLIALPQITKEELKTTVSYPALIIGDRGSLKSETALEMIKKEDCPFFAIEVFGEKYRKYGSHETEPAVFSVYGQNIPFQINPLTLFPGETTQSHIERLILCFALSFHFPEGLLAVLREALRRCYLKKANPLLFDLFYEADAVITEQCSPNEAKQYQIAMEQTLLELCKNEKEIIYNGKNSFDFISWLRQPVVIELDAVIDAREKAFLMGLLSFGVISGAQYLRQREEGFSHLLLIEEAHRFFDGRVEHSYEYSHYFQSAIDLITLSAYHGEKLLFTEPSALLIPDAIYQLSATKIIHKVTSNQAKNLLVERTGITKEEYNRLGTLKKGKNILQI